MSVSKNEPENLIETDEELFDRYERLYDNDALKVLLERHREELTFFIYGILKNMEDAEDIMLDAYATIASRTAKFSRKSSFKTWLFGIARNLACNSLRKRRFFFLPLNEEVDTAESDSGLPEVELLKEERNKILYESMKAISPEYRQVLHLMYFENMEVDEIAEVMGKSKKQVYNLSTRGRQALKEKMEEAGYEHSGTEF